MTWKPSVEPETSYSRSFARFLAFWLVIHLIGSVSLVACNSALVLLFSLRCNRISYGSLAAERAATASFGHR